VEVEYRDGRVAQEELRFVVVHASQLAQQQTQTYAARKGKKLKPWPPTGGRYKPAGSPACPMPKQ
jgi:hypothetical protein